jgi:hypothetical protein
MLAPAQLAVLVQYAMDMHDGQRGSLAPPPDPRLSPDWILVGHLTAKDCFFRIGPAALGEVVHYGFLAQSAADPGQYVAVIRGTDGLVEWAEDAEFLALAHKSGGTVEQGFWGVYSSLVYAPLAQPGPLPAYLGLSRAIGPDGRLTVVGHSLGAALATYLTYDVAEQIPGRAAGRFFASPRPGNAALGKAFDTLVADYQVFNYARDVVPQLPYGPDYSTLPKVSVISDQASQAIVRDYLTCFHHVICYAARLDYALADWHKFGDRDASLTGCILGPNSESA